MSDTSRSKGEQNLATEVTEITECVDLVFLLCVLCVLCGSIHILVCQAYSWFNDAGLTRPACIGHSET